MRISQLVLPLVLSAAAGAQESFQIDQSQSHFRFSGTTTLGPISGNPSDMFDLTGTVALLLLPGGPLPSTGSQFAGADALAVPDLHAKVTGAFGIKLAEIDVVGMRLSFGSGGFAVASNGDFDAHVTATVTAGTMTITPLVGQPSVSDITGATSPLTLVQGNLAPSSCVQRLDMPNVSLDFQFTDVPTGLSADVNVAGTLRASWAAPGAVTYCTAKPGLVCGTPSIQWNGCPETGKASGFVASAAPARAQKAGLLIYTTAGRANLPFNGGTLCVAPTPLKRSSAIDSGGTPGGCDGVFAIDFNAFAIGALGGNPLPELQTPGTVVDAQFWGRDSPASGSFLSDAIEFVML